ncbi:hypothetical protein BOX15_Mlig003708g1 [Macrostomum lignano]|uniref:GPS domain-containing protein n=1 Tax=Macrostomum lignano TaxID=282301 RepID=A0A267F7P4_9PLAT|nr:hypothetical protein BOX15_Mlig003708g1 [Macrostomum lignano]
MKQAWLYGVPIGPNGFVSSYSGYAMINTNGEVGVKAYKANECPRSLSDCKFQVLLSTWIQVRSKANDTSFTVLSLGSESDSKEGFGLSIASDNTLRAWVKRSGQSYKMVTKSGVKVRLNRWLNLGLLLNKNTFYPTIFLNGTNVSMSLEYTSVNPAVSDNTAPGTLKLGANNAEATSSGSFLAYIVSGWYGATVLKNHMNQMLGIQSSQYELIGMSDEFWTVSGLWNSLQPRPLQGVNVQLDNDKYDMESGAMCTTGSGGSYISLGDLQDSCLQNTAPCKAYILTINFKPRMPTTPGRKYVFSSGGQNAGHLGTAISISSEGFLIATVRSANKTCEAMVPFNYTEWIQLQVRWYSEAAIAIKVNEETISSRVGANSTCWQEWNDNATFSDGQLGKVNNNVTNALSACFSEVMFMYQLLGSSGSLDLNVGPANCYEQQTVHVPLYSAGQTNYANKPNQSRLFSQKESVDIGTDACFFTAAGCPEGVVLSFWLKVASGLSVNTEVEVFNTGFDAAQGVQVKIMKDDNKGFIIVADANLNGKSRRVEGSKHHDQVAFDTWVNVAISVGSDAIELYQNGIRVRAATKFSARDLPLPTGSTVSFGSPSVQIVASDLVIWNESPLNCLDPNKNRKLITGDCSTPTATLEASCMPENASSCMSAIENNMCLDPRFDNVAVIDLSGQLFSSLTETETACGVIYNTAKTKGVSQGFIQSSLNILTRVCDNLVIPSTVDNDTLLATVKEFSRAFSAVLDPKFTDSYRGLVDKGAINPATIFASIENFAIRLAGNVKTDCSPVLLTEGGMHWSTQKIGPGCSGKENNRIGYYDKTHKNWKKTKDAVHIPNFLASSSVSDFLMVCVVYDGVENLLSYSATNETTYSNIVNSTIELKVNSRVMSLWLSLPVSPKPVNFTLMLLDPNLKKKEGTLKYETRCAFWHPTENKWSTEGCYKDSEDEDSVNCRCDHMTSFAILMQPVPQAEDNIHARILSILTYILIILSLICLLIFIIVIACSKRLRGERYIIHLNLAGALFVAQLAFLFTQIARDNADFCKAIAIIMHLFFVATFAMLFIESLWVFYAVTKGIIRGRLKWWLPVAWLIPVVIVGIVGGINSGAYGGPHCWITGVYIWAFLGPLVAFGCLSLLVCLIVVCNLSEPAIKRKDILNDLRNHTHQCAFLIPLMIIAWLFGILLVQWYNIPIEYFFVIFNASQGIWVFVCFGLFNPDFREVICLRRSRSSVASSSVSITGVQDINSSKTSFETGSQVAIVPKSASSPKQKGKKPQEQQQQQQQPSAPVYYSGKPKKQQRDSDDEEETSNSRARLQAGSARSLRSSSANLGVETEADRPGTPRTEKFTPPGTVE